MTVFNTANCQKAIQIMAGWKNEGAGIRVKDIIVILFELWEVQQAEANETLVVRAEIALCRLMSC